METKTFALREVKALVGADDPPGTFEAVVAVFGNVDDGGDRIIKGAFAATLAPPPEGRGLPPVVWSHEWQVPPIGAIESAAETDEGLQIKGRLFVGPDEDHAVARQVYAAMKAQDGQGRSPLREFSFGFRTLDSAIVTEDGEEIRELRALELFEVGPTLVGMNPATRLVGVKALEREVATQLAQALPAKKKDAETDKPDAKDRVSDELAATIGPVLHDKPKHHIAQEG